MPTPSYKILIAGGGIGGFSAAVELALKGHSVTVLERTPTLQSIGGSLLIPPQACKVIDSWGCHDRFLSADEIREKLMIFRYADGTVIGSNNLGWQKDVYGYQTLNIQREDYQKMLYERALELGVKVKFGCKVDNIDQAAPSITLADDEVHKADLIIGADGVRSKVRTAVLGEVVEPRVSDTAYICRFPGDLMRADPLTAPMMAHPDPHGWLAPGRHAVASPGCHGAIYGIILIIDKEHGPRSRLANGGDIKELRDRYQDHEPRVRKILDMVKEDDCRLWRISMLPDLKSWVSESGKVVLLGDAAHAMHPYLAQGSAMATEDAAALGECLSRATEVSQVPLAMKTYESIRKPRAEKLKAASEFSGLEKHYPDGEKQRKRGELMMKGTGTQVAIPKKGEKNMHPSAWVHGHDVRGHTNAELDRIFGKDGVAGLRNGVPESLGEGLIA
ncbi:FAD/NAD(P)-binding domain-containing protein [Acephala macrosclerotiorum]|nr:FAD/NAD(P)-binding domain-containing protein [Acephala macrosclerotiorum]